MWLCLTKHNFDRHNQAWRAIQDFFPAGVRQNAENQGHSSIELEMSKQYIDELRAKRASHVEARNVQNYMKWWYARYKLSSIELEMSKQYIDELRAKRASNFEARNVQNCMKLWYARFACYN